MRFDGASVKPAINLDVKTREDLEQLPKLIVPGPAGLLPPFASSLGIVLPEPGQGLYYGWCVPEELVMDEIARQLLTKKNRTLHPGPLILWAWTEHTKVKADAVLKLSREIPGVKIIPMPDYRPKYPKIDPEEVINPNHPNLTILHNKEEVCAFVGVHCHYANLTLKMIRAGTPCLTIALCAMQGHEDAMLSLRDFTEHTCERLTETVRRVRIELGISDQPVEIAGDDGVMAGILQGPSDDELDHIMEMEFMKEQEEGV